MVYVCKGGAPEIEIYVTHEESPTTHEEGKEKERKLSGTGSCGTCRTL